MRGWFAVELHRQMSVNKDIFLLVGDLGYKVFDNHFKDFPERTYNCGASEQTLIGVGVGLALQGKIPFCYSITPFLIYRPFETIRNYIDHEQIPVKLIGSGRDRDYLDDGFSHWSEETKRVMQVAFPSIGTYWPEAKEDIPDIMEEVVNNGRPSFVSLRR